MNVELFAKRLKDLRKSRGFSQDIVAQLTGLDRTTICKYEKGERKPSIDTLIILSRVFKVSMNYLCGLLDEINMEVDIITYQKIMSLLNDYGE